MDKLLKEAIADAKSVRETALANAKIALEEAFTPHLKSMLSKKLQAEMEGEDEESHDEGYHGEEEEEKVDEEMDSSGIGAADNKEPEEEAGDTSDIGQGPESEGGDEEGGNEDENMEDAPDQPMGEGYGMEDEDEEAPAEGMHDEEDEDLEEVLRQLEAEMADEDEEEAPAEGMHDEEEVEEAHHAEDEDKVEEGEHMEDEDEEVDEEIDLDEIIKALTEEEGMEDEDEEVAEEMEDEDSELEEYKKTVLYLKNKLSEVNLLNAKLLYTNKLFRSRNISEAQKMKVIEQFDRTTSVREVKLVYSTFAESIKRKPVNESRRVSKASKPVASTKSKKPIIGENTDFKARMKKLANII
jgi:hypothetical protein